MDGFLPQALETLGPDVGFRIMNEVRPESNYLFQRILPERNISSYHVEDGTMTVRSTMAGLVGMDSPYPEGGLPSISTFLERTAKLAIAVDLPEGILRTLQELAAKLRLGGGNVPQQIARELFNIEAKLLRQPHTDTAEWLRGQALATGAIDWTFNGKTLTVDYGVPDGNFLTNRTGNDGYGGSTSKFWVDVAAAKRLLRQNVLGFIAHPNMIDAIIYNAANSLQVVSQTLDRITVRRMVEQNGLNTPSPDAREVVTILSYGLEAEVLDISNPGQTTIVPFMPDTKLIAVGRNTGTQYVVGAGGNPPQDFELGWTAVAPTVEGGGATGRWARIYVPEQRPWSLRGEAVSNVLPVINAPEKLVVLSSALP